jgi:hypothetical protein
MDSKDNPFESYWIESQVAHYIFLRKSNRNNIEHYREVLVTLVGESRVAEIDQLYPV